MKYLITIKKSAAKELENLPAKVLKSVTKAIYSLADEPRPKGCKKLKGQTECLFRIRLGDYRVVYSVDDIVQIVDVKKAGHRRDIYEK